MSKTPFYRSRFSRNRGLWVKTMLIIFPLVAGGLIYIFFSPAPRLFFNWLPGNSRTPLHSWIVYSLPDGLWAFSLVLFLLFALRGRRFIVAALAISAALMPEFLQGIHIIPGTFDWIDVISILLFGGTAACVRIFFSVEERRGRHAGSHFLRPVVAGSGIIVFMVIAMGTSEDKPYRVMKRATNTTGYPMTVYVSASYLPDRLIVIYTDSARAQDTIHFYYLEQNYTGESTIARRCPSKDISAGEVLECHMIGQDQQRTSFQDFMRLVEPYCATVLINTRGKQTLRFTLAPGESFPFTYSEWHGRLFDETPGRYYSIYYTNKQGKDTSVFMAAPQLDVFLSGQGF